ncbi:uroporphyrinogen-III synthase HEM4 [Ascoidea rubescens DSM 1968]|uniref:Uroporphyrinogen III synthase n=1 Tax=Ascoidea rubescens DSM 1968 TaxID=1344418 RepID=A0A1D2VC22_9ASCO|nr:Uroporphyrinogen III synthase [Ascoidea rubescens DSM 1968]ODV59186.1 Uroporphyrinogen III synthase [Ascoidea rubescens DSM 1968]
MASTFLLLKNKTVARDKYQLLFEQYFCPRSVGFLPLIQHVYIANDCLWSYLLCDDFLAGALAIVITSQRAVEAIHEAIATHSLSYDSRLETVFNKTVYAVGPATAELLHTCGFKNIKGGYDAGNSDVLSDIVIDNESLRSDYKEKNVVFFTGEKRKDILPKKLRKFGFNLIEYVVYKTIPISPENTSREFNHYVDCNINHSHPNTDHWFIFFSPQGVSEILDYLKNNQNKNFKIASIGPTTQMFLLQNGILPHVIAPKPEPVSLCQSIQEYIRNQ